MTGDSGDAGGPESGETITPLVKLFLLCSHMHMDKIDTARVAETILSAPGWARVGITAPTSHIRVEAAFELARAIIESMRVSAEPSSPDQLGLSL